MITRFGQPIAEVVPPTGEPAGADWMGTLAGTARMQDDLIEPALSPEDWIRGALSSAPLHEAPLNHEVALWSRRVSLAHPDPADRFLAATAAVYELTLVTADARLLRGKGYPTLRAR